MILDGQAQFSAAQALTATAVSTNVIDLKGDFNLGIGEPMSIVVSLDVASDFTTGDETYVVTLQTGSSATPTTVIATKEIVGANAAGSKFVIGVPADSSCEQYLRLNYTLAGTSPSVTVSAYLVQTKLVDNYVQYANNYTIS